MANLQHLDLPLILGGHSFITQLGNDPAADFDEQVAIVRTCLDQGIRWIDTTYQPERLMLGKILSKLYRRVETKIIAWNFFREFDGSGELGGPEYLQSHHLQLMLDQLQVDRLDALVVHWIGADESNRAQEELALQWVSDGRVSQLGIWGAPADAVARFSTINPYQFMVLPANINTPGVEAKLAWGRAAGWQNVATSPYVRGWHLDKLATKALARDGGKELEVRAKLANLMLRYALYLPNVDRLIVAMRKAEWVDKNVAAALQGALTPAEQQWLMGLQNAL